MKVRIISIAASLLATLLLSQSPLAAQDDGSDPTLHTKNPGAAADVSPEERDALAIFTEAVNLIAENSLKQESKPVIIRKAIGELIGALDADLGVAVPEIPDDEAAAQQVYARTLSELLAAPGQRLSARNLVEKSISLYCRTVDIYSKYDRSEEMAKYNRAQNSGLASGIGVSLQEESDEFFCYPFPGGAAEGAGVEAGDKLLGVDGKTVSGLSIIGITNLVRGAPGTPVTLKLQRTYGQTATVSIMREMMEIPVVQVEKELGGVVVRIRRFTQQGAGELEKALAGTGSGSVTLDLRGCSGGEVNAAVKMASFFLPEGSVVGYIRLVGQDEITLTTDSPQKFTPSTLVLLQDSGTASSAELFIASLIQNPQIRAVSQGGRTFGKGVVLKPLELDGGGRLTITAGEMRSPLRQSWDRVGLLPSLTNAGKILPAEASAPASAPEPSASVPKKPSAAPASDAKKDANSGEINDSDVIEMVPVGTSKGPGGN